VSKGQSLRPSLLSGLPAIERVKAAGGRFVSVQDGLDTSTDSGRLVLHILLSLAEWEGDRIRAEWDQARASAIKRGVYMSAGSPVGYRKTRSGRLQPAPEAGAPIVEVFRRRAEGESFSSLARWLGAQGVLTGYGKPGWTSISMAKLVRSSVWPRPATCWRWARRCPARPTPSRSCCVPTAADVLRGSAQSGRRPELRPAIPLVATDAAAFGEARPRGGVVVMRPGPRKVSQRARRARRIKGPGFASGP
jgi:hypothetical protein